MGLMGFDLQRVLAQQVRRDGFMNMCFGGTGAIKALAEANDALIGVQLHPQDVWKFIKPDCIDCVDFHGLTGLPDIFSQHILIYPWFKTRQLSPDGRPWGRELYFKIYIRYGCGAV